LEVSPDECDNPFPNNPNNPIVSLDHSRGVGSTSIEQMSQRAALLLPASLALGCRVTSLGSRVKPPFEIDRGRQKICPSHHEKPKLGVGLVPVYISKTQVRDFVRLQRRIARPVNFLRHQLSVVFWSDDFPSQEMANANGRFRCVI
jgi:hypothetical protein